MRERQVRQGGESRRCAGWCFRRLRSESRYIPNNNNTALSLDRCPRHVCVFACYEFSAFRPGSGLATILSVRRIVMGISIQFRRVASHIDLLLLAAASCLGRENTVVSVYMYLQGDLAVLWELLEMMARFCLVAAFLVYG